VPGNLGGGVAMNAGGRWGDMWDVVELVRVLDADGAFQDLPRERCAPRYRDGGLGGAIVLGAVLHLRVDDPPAVKERVRGYLLEKRRIQPVTEWSAGCIFKNPPREASDGRSAGKLIEDAGAKGRARGDAVVSELHGNFIVNRGGGHRGRRADPDRGRARPGGAEVRRAPRDRGQDLARRALTGEKKSPGP
jgi:UDP-N-acetylmuramate dehydrogenase